MATRGISKFTQELQSAPPTQESEKHESANETAPAEENVNRGTSETAELSTPPAEAQPASPAVTKQEAPLEMDIRTVGVPEGSIVIPPDHPDYEFIKNRPQAGAEIYGCVMVDKKLFAKLYHACVQNNTHAVTGQAAVSLFAKMLGLVNGNNEKNLALYRKFRDFHTSK